MRRPFNEDYGVFFPFGATSAPYSTIHPHRGNDYPLPLHTDIVAPEAGYATQNYAPDFGFYTQVDSPDYVHFLAHEFEGEQLGEGWVKEGQRLAKSGSSGQATGPHLHWQVLDKASGQWIDSESLLNKGEDVLNYDQVDSMAHAYLNDSIANNKGLEQYVGKPAGEVIAAFNGAPQRAEYLKRIEDLEQNEAQKKLDKIKQIVG